MQIQRKSALTGRTHIREIDITPAQYARWEAGTYIQDAAPHLSAADREYIVSGVTPEEWTAALSKVKAGADADWTADDIPF